MKRLALSAMLGIAMVATAAAQAGSAGSTTSGGSSSSGSMSGSSSTQDQSSTPSTSSSSTSGNMSASSKDHNDSGKKAKMTGCISSQGGSYYLVDKKHPNGVQLLSNEDLSAHVGHKVEVKGNWESASASSASSPSSSASSSTPSSSASSTSPSTSASASGSTSDASNPASAGSGSASSLPQSDVGAGKAIRVSEVKMKSDTCEGGNKSSNPSTPK
jgi:hypothetical protein